MKYIIFSYKQINLPIITVNSGKIRSSIGMDVTEFPLTLIDSAELITTGILIYIRSIHV